MPRFDPRHCYEEISKIAHTVRDRLPAPPKSKEEFLLAMRAHPQWTGVAAFLLIAGTYMMVRSCGKGPTPELPPGMAPIASRLDPELQRYIADTYRYRDNFQWSLSSEAVTTRRDSIDFQRPPARIVNARGQTIQVYRDYSGLAFYCLQPSDKTLPQIRAKLKGTPFEYASSEGPKIDTFNVSARVIASSAKAVQRGRIDEGAVSRVAGIPRSVIPIPLPPSSRMVNDREFLFHTVEGLVALSHDSHYGDAFRRQLGRIDPTDAIVLAVAIAKLESGAKPIGSHELHRFERHIDNLPVASDRDLKGVYSFGPHHILDVDWGHRARKHLALTPGQVYHPVNSSKLFFAFLIEKEINLSDILPLTEASGREFARLYNGPDDIEGYWRRLKREFAAVKRSFTERFVPLEQIASLSPQDLVTRYLDDVSSRGLLEGDEKVAVAAIDLESGEYFVDHQRDLPIQAASMMKPFVLAAFLAEARAGRVAYGPIADAAATEMIQHSSNSHTNDMIRWLGGPKAVQRILNETYPDIFRDTSIVESIPAGGKTYRNLTSMADCMRFCKALYDGRVIGSETIREKMALPKRTRINGRAEEVPDEAETESKTGTTAMSVGEFGMLGITSKNGKESWYAFGACIETPKRRGDTIALRSAILGELSDAAFVGRYGRISGRDSIMWGAYLLDRQR